MPDLVEFWGLAGEHLFFEFSFILFAAAGLGLLGVLLKQPLIVTFILLGILLGPAGFSFVKSFDAVELLAEMGIAVLLFIVGLKLDLRIIQSVGRVALLTGMGQVIFTCAIGYLIALGLGFAPMASFYISVALTFSSTIIIVKLLSDKKEIDSLHGRIAVGFLIVQDLVVILVMIVLSTLRNSSEAELGPQILLTLVKGFGFFFVVMALARWILPKVTRVMARSQELLVLFAIAWAVGLASVALLIGFSGEVGAFLGGVSLASLPYRNLMSSRLSSLRDFLLLFFFVHLGGNLELASMGEQILPSLVLSAFVLLGNPLIVLVIMGVMGYRKRTSFLAGLTVAQISEFSLIFAKLGVEVGHIEEPTLGLITLVGLVTIGCSTYMILYSHWIFDRLSPWLSFFERKSCSNLPGHTESDSLAPEVLVLGLGRFGAPLLKELHQAQYTVLGVDFDPSVIRSLQGEGLPVLYGDLDDSDLVEHIDSSQLRKIFVTVPDRELASALGLRLRAAFDERVETHFVVYTVEDGNALKTVGFQNVHSGHELTARFIKQTLSEANVFSFES